MRVSHDRGWAYGGVALGAGVSVSANVAHTYVLPVGVAPGWRPEVGAVGLAAFWPIALFIAIEIFIHSNWDAHLRRIDGRWRWLRYLDPRVVGLLLVSVVAAVVSYRHLSGLLRHYHEDGITTTIGPLAVDGLMIMASAVLVTARRLPSTSKLEVLPQEHVVPVKLSSAAPIEPSQSSNGQQSKLDQVIDRVLSSEITAKQGAVEVGMPYSTFRGLVHRRRSP